MNVKIASLNFRNGFKWVSEWESEIQIFHCALIALAAALPIAVLRLLLLSQDNGAFYYSRNK